MVLSFGSTELRRVLRPRERGSTTSKVMPRTERNCLVPFTVGEPLQNTPRRMRRIFDISKIAFNQLRDESHNFLGHLALEIRGRRVVVAFIVEPITGSRSRGRSLSINKPFEYRFGNENSHLYVTPYKLKFDCLPFGRDRYARTCLELADTMESFDAHTRSGCRVCRRVTCHARHRAVEGRRRLVLC